MTNNDLRDTATNRDLREVRDRYSALRDLVIQYPGGWDDVVTRMRVMRLCEEAKAALDDGECRERLRVVEAQAADLYSEDGHRRWSRRAMSGSDYLRLQILISLEALNTRLFHLESLRNRAQGAFAADSPAPELP